MAKLKPATIKASGGGSVTVDRTGDDTVRIDWVCGARVSYTPARLRQALENFDLAMSYNGDTPVWLEDVTGDGQRFACKLEDGRFYADGAVTHRDPSSVPWSTFRKALVARAK